MAAMGHQKKAQRIVKDCPSCGKPMEITLQGTSWRSTNLKSYWVCLNSKCNQDRIRVKGSGHQVVMV